MTDDPPSEGLKQRLSRQGEEAIGRLAEELAANPVVSSALAGAFEARERAVAAQEAAMGALGIPSAADIERLTRRVRSVSQRLEGIEDALDRLDDRLARLDGIGERIEAVGASELGPAESVVEQRLEELRADVSALREAVAPGAGAMPRAQERLAVAEAEAPAPARRPSGGRRSSARGKAGSRGSGGRAAASPRRAASSARSGGSTSPGSGSGR